ncbi:MAG: 3'-5' exonuclease [Burkholderiales bacterium]
MTSADRPARPTAEQIAALPAFESLPLERITLVETAAQAEAAHEAIARVRAVGFDTESKPTFTRDAVRDGPHVIQLALSDRAFVVQVNAQAPLAFLRVVLESTSIAKVGFGLDSDRGPLQRKLGIAVHPIVELSQLLRGLGHRQALGAKAAVAVVLGRRLHKSRSVTTSNWALPRLSPAQLLYAANDAYAALKVFEAMGSPWPAGAAQAPRVASAAATTSGEAGPPAPAEPDRPQPRRPQRARLLG